MQSPTHYLAASIEDLSAQLPRVRDGDRDAIHDARVATRRIREALPIVSAMLPDMDLDPVRATSTAAGRALGRARDVDVALDLIGEIERRAPHATESVAPLRRELLLEQASARRRLIKKIDALPLDEMFGLGRRIGRRSVRTTTLVFPVRRVAHELLEAVRARAGALRTAITHGSGVYFPKRSHATRVDLKRLRYLLEIAGRPKAAASGMTLLKKTQSVLGQLHDVEVLRSHVERRQEREPWPGGQDTLVTALLHAEGAALFARYLRRRAALLDLCRTLEQTKEPAWSISRAIGGAVVGVGAVATTAWLFGPREPLPLRADVSRRSTRDPTGTDAGSPRPVAGALEPIRMSATRRGV